MVAPSLLLAGDTKRRFLDLKMGAKALAYLPLTVLPLLIFTIFAVNFLSEIPVLNASWLGYNISYWSVWRSRTVWHITILATPCLHVTSCQLL